MNCQRSQVSMARATVTDHQQSHCTVHTFSSF